MRNIRRVEAFEPIFKKFTENSHPDSKRPIFSTMREFLCFLAVLGFAEGMRTPLHGKTIELDARVFENNEQSRDILYLVAMAAARDVNILQPDREDELITIFEEYVATGASVLTRWLRDTPDDHVGDQAVLAALRKNFRANQTSTSLASAIDKINF